MDTFRLNDNVAVDSRQLAIFTPLTQGRVDVIKPYVDAAPTRSCDFTVGGLMLWAPYFNYAYTVVGDMLIVKGVSEADRISTAFLPPIGAGPIDRGLEVIKEMCASRGVPPLLTAVPEELLPVVMRAGATGVEELRGFDDYLYRAEALASLSGKKLAKKRNHVNRFLVDNPDCAVEEISLENIDQVIDFYEKMPVKLGGSSGLYDRLMTRGVLHHWGEYPFEGTLLRIGREGVVAFSIAEVMGDTVHVHIEKANHEVAGAGEAINKFGVERIMSLNDRVEWVNRQDDAGDEGLRRAKLSYCPASLIHKYNVTL